MEHDNGENLDWSMQRRVDGLVNKHMADIALETLQNRLCAVSDEMHSLAEHVSRRSGEELKDESRQGDDSFDVEPLSSDCSTEATEKFISASSTGKQSPSKLQIAARYVWMINRKVYRDMNASLILANLIDKIAAQNRDKSNKATSNRQ